MQAPLARLADAHTHAPTRTQDGSARTPVYCLDNGASESLRVAPALRRLSFVQFSSAASGSERMGATIHLHFEGNWMPIKVRPCLWVGRE